MKLVGDRDAQYVKQIKAKLPQDGCVMNVHTCDLGATKLKCATDQPLLDIIFKYLLYWDRNSHII